MNVEFDVNIKLKGKMSLRKVVVLVVGGIMLVANLMSTNGTIINKIESAARSVITSSK
jgi:hypothetical protein